MKWSMALVVLLPICAVASYAQTSKRGAAQSVAGGWSKARFGMTTAQVITSFAGKATKLDPPESYEDDKYLARAEISDTKIGPIEHALVRFVFPRGKDRLERIYITESVVKPAADVDVRMRAEYEQLSKMLIEKYGRPAKETKDNARETETFEESTTWTLPIMVVELYYQHMKFYGKEMSCFLSISYHPPLSAAERERL